MRSDLKLIGRRRAPLVRVAVGGHHRIFHRVWAARLRSDGGRRLPPAAGHIPTGARWPNAQSYDGQLYRRVSPDAQRGRFARGLEAGGTT